MNQPLKVYFKNTPTGGVHFFKFKDPTSGAWRNKQIPVDVPEEQQATWALDWLARSNVAADSQGSKTLRSLAPRWLELIKADKDEKTHDSCQRMVKRYLLRHPIADVDLERDLDTARVVQWIDWLKQQKANKKDTPLAPLTLRNIVQALREFIVDARGRGWVPRLRENPVADPYVQRVMGKPERLAGDEPKVISEQQARALITPHPKVPEFRRLYYEFAIRTGLRLGEIQALSWEHLRLDDPIPHVRVLRKLVKAKRGLAEPKFALPKSRKVRWVPLHSALVAALREWHAHGVNDWADKPTADSPVFPSRGGKYQRTGMSRFIKRDLAAMEMSTTFTATRGTTHALDFHATRRTCNTLLRQAGAPADVRDQVLGHGSKTVGDRHYLGRSLEACAPWIAKVLP